MDLVPSNLCDRLSSREISLSYMILEDANSDQLEPHEFGIMMRPSYEFIMDELISCTPHNGDEIAEDNAKVFRILQDMVSGISFESMQLVG